MSSILSHITQTSASSLQGTQPNQAVKQSFLQHNINSEFWGSNMNVWRKSAPGSCEKNCVIVVSATSRATAVIFLPRSRPFYPSPPLLLLLVLHTSAQLFRFSPLFLFSYTIIEATKVNTYSQLKEILADNKRKYLLPPRSIDHSSTHEVKTICQHIHLIFCPRSAPSLEIQLNNHLSLFCVFLLI